MTTHKPPKITLLKSRLAHHGGLEKYTLTLAEAFAQKECEVTILTTDTPPPLPKNIQAISLGKSSKFSLYHLYHFNQLCKKWLAQNPSDIIFGMERNDHQTHYRAGSGVHKQYLQQRKLNGSFWRQISFKFNPLHYLLLHYEKKAFESPHLKHLFTNSQMVKEEISSYYQTDPKKIVVVHNGVEWAKKAQDFQTISPQKAFHFLFIGNGYKRKGLEYLLPGFAMLSSTAHLTVVGREKNLAHFQKMAKQLRVDDRVHFVGPSQNPTPYYQKADALVIPSIYDPFANVTLEGLAMGLFVVTSQYNGGKEILTTQNGTVIESLTSPKSVKKSLEIALQHPKTLESAQLIRNSVKELDFSKQLDTIIQLTLSDI